MKATAPATVVTGVVDRGFIRVGPSPIHGTGVFARRRIPWGARIIEYTGTRAPIATAVAMARGGDGSAPAPPVYAFQLDDDTLIDGARGGGDARFVNHSCAPNCEALCFEGHIYFYALREIRRGEELTLDYRLASPSRYRTTRRDREAHRCRCGSPACRGTLLATRPAPSR